MKSARGSPGGRDVDARAPRRCVVSARRVAGSMTHWGSGPFPTGYLPSPWLRGCCRDTAGAERPADRWASGAGPLQVHPQALKEWLPPGVLCSSPWSGRRGPRRRGRPGAEVGGARLSKGRADYLLCADPQSWKPERGDGALERKAGSRAASSVDGGKMD